MGNIEAQENAENFTSELDQVKITLKQTEEEKNRLEEELTRVRYLLLILCLLYHIICYWFQVKNILKKEITKADTEINRDQTIIKEYKQVNNYYYKLLEFGISRICMVFFCNGYIIFKIQYTFFFLLILKKLNIKCFFLHSRKRIFNTFKYSYNF